ncbi:hypothetical protein [Bacillus sp. J33]|uniref:hypothetical protein n=1 Tax=Bacillus sp. J33 TaxID=935836 RepID=UPI0004B84DAB|nr:hypothetical protein [Bacillus sp. J33]
MFALGEIVTYHGKKYEIIHIYDSGYIEIKKNKLNIKLVHSSEIEKRAEKVHTKIMNQK